MANLLDNQLMKKALLICLLPFGLLAQLTISDDFNDSNFTADPGWLGDTGIFRINANKELQLNDTSAGEAYLYTGSTIAEDATWEFELRMDFNPSGSNYCRIYLMSDQSDFTGSLNGYYVRVSGSSADRLSLYRQDGNSSALLTESGDDYVDVSNVYLRCRVSRSNGNWSLEADTGLIMDPLVLIGTTIDSMYKSSTYFGVNPHYTTTRSDKFFFDNFNLSGEAFTDDQPPRLDSVFVEQSDRLQVFFSEAVALPGAEDETNYLFSNGVGQPVNVIQSAQNFQRVDVELATNLLPNTIYQLKVSGVEDAFGNISNDSIEFTADNPAPALSQISVQNSTTLQLSFSEEIAQNRAEDETAYFVSGSIGQPDLAQQNTQDPTQVVLAFSNPFQNNSTYTLQIQGLEDDFGNTLDTNVSFTFFIPGEGSVVINEIMADPNPVVGVPPNSLPEREYLELYNREDVPVNLKDWVLQIGTTREVLSFYELGAKDYVVITKDEGAGEFAPTVPVLGLDMSSTALTNDGNEITLFSKEGVQVFTVSYTGDWYKDANKDDGGWSLEQIDPDNQCGGISNWAASIDPVGGTPGRENSLLGQNPDTTRPRFDRIAVLGDSLIQLSFTEKVDESLLNDESNYRIEPTLDLLLAEPQAPAYTSVKLYFNEAIDPNVIYRLSLTSYPSDCNNNSMLPDTLFFTIPSVPEEGDILVNEILFNPLSGGSDFVELYNHSQRLFDLKYLRLGHIDPAFRDITDVEVITGESFLFEPGRYLALTTDKAYLLENYDAQFPGNIIEINRLPAMSDDEGSIAVATSAFTLIDFYEYSEDHHLSLIDPEGVSLERQSFEGPSNDPVNWQSAASPAGYATPGYENSQRIRPDFSMMVGVEPKVFSPNQDGYHDVVTLSYNFEVANNILSVSIWNASGYKLKDLLQNQNVSQRGFVTWDGTDASGNRLNSGIYIVVFDYFNTDGTHEVQKETCVLSL